MLFLKIIRHALYKDMGDGYVIVHGNIALSVQNRLDT